MALGSNSLRIGKISKAIAKAMQIGIWPSQSFWGVIRQQIYHWNRHKTAVLDQEIAKMWVHLLASNFSSQIWSFGCHQGCVIFSSINENINFQNQNNSGFQCFQNVQNSTIICWNRHFQTITIDFHQNCTFNDWKPEVNCWKA